MTGLLDCVGSAPSVLPLKRGGPGRPGKRIQAQSIGGFRQVPRPSLAAAYLGHLSVLEGSCYQVGLGAAVGHKASLPGPHDKVSLRLPNGR